MDLLSIALLLILTLLLLLISLLFILWMLQNLIFQAPFLPIPHSIVRGIASQITLSSGDEFYDLGSGDGRIVRAVALKHPQAHCFGVEKALVPHLIATFLNTYKRLPNIHLIRDDYRKVALNRARIVFVYLYPTAMEELSTKLKAELPKGAKVVSARFTLPGLELVDTTELQTGSDKFKLYIYAI